MIIYEGTNNFVSGAFLKCFRILYCIVYHCRSSDRFGSHVKFSVQLA